MLNLNELVKISEMIPAKTRYAVIASFADVTETADTWDDLDHVHYCQTWLEACEAKRTIERESDNELVGYITAPQKRVE